jgi:hypothetical protein
VANKDPALALDPRVLDALRSALPVVAAHTVAAVVAEVPPYGEALRGSEMATTIESAVATALGAFLGIAEQGEEAGTPLAPAVEAAYALGRGEARSGRSIDTLLAAYRVGARVAWREQSTEMVRRRVPARTIARFAELVFAYIDELSASSVAGHADELATSGRVRDQQLERLGRALLEGQPTDELEARAERVGWHLPDTLAAVVLPAAQARAAVQLLDPRTLVVSGEVAAVAPPDSTVLLVPDVGKSREALLRVLEGRAAAAGPARHWTETHVSYRRVIRALELLPAPGMRPLDTENNLVALVLSADADALEDLRARTLAPLSPLRPAVADRLTETLRSWLLHQGRREEVATELHVHPQTVRYRMTQLRELFGDRLTDPSATTELIVALALPMPR